MGSGQSARKLTIPNEEGVVIKVSTAVVERLAKAGGEAAAESVSEVRHAARAPAASAQTAHASAVAQDDDESSKDAPCCQGKLTYSAFQMLQLKDQELDSQERYWSIGLKKLEENYQHIESILDREYRKAKAEVVNAATGKPKVVPPSSEKPCLESCLNVLHCYEEYPKETLKCSSIVEEFAGCVDQRRARVIATF